MGWDWNTFWFVVIIGALLVTLVLLFFWFLSLRRKGVKAPSHVELYFDENFRRIMDEWDFTTRDRVKEFKKDMVERLSKVGNEIDLLEERKSSLGRRMDSLEKQTAKLEGL